MKCKKCGQEVDKKAVVCTGCGCKIAKPIYKKWWFWAIIIIACFVIGSSAGNNEPTTVNETDTSVTSDEIVYEVVDLQVLFDELDANAMKAENNYQNKIADFTFKFNIFILIIVFCFHSIGI